MIRCLHCTLDMLCHCFVACLVLYTLKVLPALKGQTLERGDKNNARIWHIKYVKILFWVLVQFCSHVSELAWILCLCFILKTEQLVYKIYIHFHH